jgi:hypothetical protein
MNPTIAGSLIASGATVVSFTLGALTTAAASRIATNRALRERAHVVYSQVVAGITRMQVTVDDFNRRRTSRRAKSLVASEAVFDLVAAIGTGSNKMQKGVRSLAETYKRVNAWDRDESDRVTTRLDAVSLELHPAIFLLSLMDKDLAKPTQALGDALNAYTNADTEAIRQTKSEQLTAALFELGRTVGAVGEARWSHVLPRPRKLKQALTSRRRRS